MLSQLQADSIVYSHLDRFIPKFTPSTKIYNKTSDSGFLTVMVKRFGKNIWEIIDFMKPNILTNNGRDFIHNQSYKNTSAGTAGANWVGVTPNEKAPAYGDEFLEGEIITGGLERIEATVGHTNGTNTSTLYIMFKSTGEHIGLKKAGTFNQQKDGILVHVNTFTKTDLGEGDQLGLVWLLTLG